MKIAALVVLAALGSVCRGHCEVDCGAAGLYVSAAGLPPSWLAEGQVTLCADSSCTTAPTSSSLYTPFARTAPPNVIAITVRHHGAVVLRSRTRHRYSLSKGGSCSCGGSISLTVDRAGAFAPYG